MKNKIRKLTIGVATLIQGDHESVKSEMKIGLRFQRFIHQFYFLISFTQQDTRPPTCSSFSWVRHHMLWSAAGKCWSSATSVTYPANYCKRWKKLKLWYHSIWAYVYEHNTSVPDFKTGSWSTHLWFWILTVSLTLGYLRISLWCSP